jgi:hypothetical protein
MRRKESSSQPLIANTVGKDLPMWVNSDVHVGGIRSALLLALLALPLFVSLLFDIAGP